MQELRAPVEGSAPVFRVTLYRGRNKYNVAVDGVCWTETEVSPDLIRTICNASPGHEQALDVLEKDIANVLSFFFHQNANKLREVFGGEA